MRQLSLSTYENKDLGIDASEQIDATLTETEQCITISLSEIDSYEKRGQIEM